MKDKKPNSEELKRVEKQISLLEKRIEEIKAMKKESGIEVSEEDLAKQVKINWLGKIQLINEVGELADKDIYCIFELVNGKLEKRYYDEDENLLGTKEQLYAHISIEDELASGLEDDEKKEKEQERIQHELEEMDEEEALKGAKNKEELAKEQERLKEEEKQEEKAKGPQLPEKRVARLTGPKIDLVEQKVDNVILANKIGLEGKYIQFVRIDELPKELISDLKLAELGQQFIPIEIYSDGTANVIGEDKLKFSTLEGSNSTNEQTTMNNDGSRRQEQGIVTFDIPGTNNCITIGFDEQNTSSPFYEAKFGTRDIEQPSEVLYDELETVNEGPLKKEKEAGFAQINNTEGLYEASKGNVTKSDAEKFAKAMGWYKYNKQGNVLGPDLERAEEYLKNNSIGDKSVKELIEEADVKTLGPAESPRPH